MDMVYTLLEVYRVTTRLHHCELLKQIADPLGPLHAWLSYTSYGWTVKDMGFSLESQGDQLRYDRRNSDRSNPVLIATVQRGATVPFRFIR